MWRTSDATEQRAGGRCARRGGARGRRQGQCDSQAIDWRNFSYPDYALHDGSGAVTDPTFHITLLDQGIVYGDIRGTGSPVAFVPVSTGASADMTLDILVYEEDPSCKPRFLFKTGGVAGSAGKIVGPSYILSGGRTWPKGMRPSRSAGWAAGSWRRR